MTYNPEMLMKEYGVNLEQLEAIDISKNIAVNAGAGSGKTRVLTARYLRLLKEDRDIGVENIVAITFTNKAALEMKERIRKLIGGEIKKAGSSDDIKRWKGIKDSMTNACISTIHSFCDFLLKENYSSLGIEPYYSIIEDVDRETVLNRIADEAVGSCILDSQNEEAVREMLGLYGSRFVISGELRKCIINLYFEIKECGFSIPEAQEITEKALREKIDESPDEFEGLDIRRIALIQNLVIEILSEVDKSYTDFKKSEGFLDFNDLEIYAAELLSDAEIASHYKKRFKYFLVDEFQDTNEIQKKIIYSLVCGDDGLIEDRRLFIVGDHKQSIYGFRGTDYRIFKEVTGDLRQRGEEKLLSICFRSLPGIINTVNSIFAHLLEPYEPLMVSEEKRDKEYKKVELICLRSEENSDDEDVWKSQKGLLKTGGTGELIKFLEKLQRKDSLKLKTDEESSILAGRIKNLVEKEGFNYRDIAVLLRGRSRLSSYENALAKLGIPYCVLGGIGFFEKQEVVDIVNLYRVLFNPNDRLSLAGVLRSPIFALSDVSLVKVMDYISKGQTAFMALSLAAADADERQGRCLKRAGEILKSLCSAAGFYNALDLLKRIIDETGYMDILLTGPRGLQKYRNIEKLLNIAREFDSKDIYSAREFPVYFDVLEEHSSGDGDAVLDTEDSDAVKILTIHASKGLEFKAVIVPDMAKDLTYMLSHSKPKIAFGGSIGITPILADDGGELKTEANPMYKRLYDASYNREIEESKRILYVAATRAQEFLVFLGKDEAAPSEPCELKSFMRQVKYALERCGDIESLVVKDGREFIRDCGEIAVPAHKIIETDASDSDSESIKRIKKILSWEYERKSSLQASISRYLKYRECPRKYYFEYISGLKDITFSNGFEAEENENRRDENIQQESEGKKIFIPASTKGTIVHRVLENIISKGIGREGVEGEIRKAALELYPDAEDMEDAVRVIKGYIDGYFKIESSIGLKSAPVKTETELSFRYPVVEGSMVCLNGVIDRIDIFRNGDSCEAVLIDYKTNRIDSPEKMEEFCQYYKCQLMVYKRAAEMLYRIDGENVKVRDVYLYFLDCGERKRVEIDEGEIASFLEEFNSTFSFIGTHDRLEDYPPCKSSKCDGCDMRALCV